MTRWKPFLLNLALMLGGFICCLAGLETGAWLWERRQAQGPYAWELVASRRIRLDRFEASSTGYMLMHPGEEYNWQGIPVCINSQGLRGPEVDLEKPPGTYRVLNLGDSVVFGWGVRYEDTYGYQLQALLSQRYGSEPVTYEIINAGVNSELAWNVLQRLDDVIRCKPDIVTVLIGSNDANSILSLKNTKSYMKTLKLPCAPDRNLFKNSLVTIVEKLKQDPNVLIGLLSIPTIGEIPENREFKISTEYSEIVKDVAQQTGVAYLPLHERMTAYLKKNPGKPTYPYEKEGIHIIKKMIQHRIFRKGRDEIGRAAGFKLHIDYLHLNSLGAEMIADMIEAFIKENENTTKELKTGKNRN